MTKRIRIGVTPDEAAALVAERAEIALRRAVEAIANRIPSKKVGDLIADLRSVGEAPRLVAALRKHLRRAGKVPDIGGEARPDPTIWQQQPDKVRSS